MSSLLPRLPLGPILLSIAFFSPASSVVASLDEVQGWLHEAETATDAEECLEKYRRIILEGEGDSLVDSVRLERLKGLYSLGRTQEAMAEWGEWLAHQSNVLEDGERVYWYSLALLDMGHVGEAAQVLEVALTGGIVGLPESTMTTMLRELLVACHLELDEPSRAAHLAMEMVRQTRSDDAMPLLLYDLARAHEASGNSGKAQETWKLLRDSYPLTPEATYAEAEIHPLEQTTGHVREEYRGEEDTETGYLLFIRSFPSTTSAALLKEKVEKLGIPVRIDELEAPSGAIFSVVAGPVVGEETAGRVKRELVSSLGIHGIVVLEQPEDE